MSSLLSLVYIVCWHCASPLHVNRRYMYKGLFSFHKSYSYLVMLPSPLTNQCKCFSQVSEVSSLMISHVLQTDYHQICFETTFTYHWWTTFTQSTFLTFNLVFFMLQKDMFAPSLKTCLKSIKNYFPFLLPWILCGNHFTTCCPQHWWLLCLILLPDITYCHTTVVLVLGVLLSRLLLFDLLQRRAEQSRGNKSSSSDNSGPPRRGRGVDCNQKKVEQEETSKLEGGMQ